MNTHGAYDDMTTTTKATRSGGKKREGYTKSEGDSQTERDRDGETAAARCKGVEN